MMLVWMRKPGWVPAWACFNQIDSAPVRYSRDFAVLTAKNSQRSGCYFSVAGGKRREFLRRRPAHWLFFLPYYQPALAGSLLSQHLDGDCRDVVVGLAVEGGDGVLGQRIAAGIHQSA
jgi:hypothetical protein